MLSSLVSPLWLSVIFSVVLPQDAEATQDAMPMPMQSLQSISCMMSTPPIVMPTSSTAYYPDISDIVGITEDGSRNVPVSDRDSTSTAYNPRNGPNAIIPAQSFGMTHSAAPAYSYSYPWNSGGVGNSKATPGSSLMAPSSKAGILWPNMTGRNSSTPTVQQGPSSRTPGQMKGTAASGSNTGGLLSPSRIPTGQVSYTGTQSRPIPMQTGSSSAAAGSVSQSSGTDSIVAVNGSSSSSTAHASTSTLSPSTASGNTMAGYTSLSKSTGQFTSHSANVESSSQASSQDVHEGSSSSVSVTLSNTTTAYTSSTSTAQLASYESNLGIDPAGTLKGVHGDSSSPASATTAEYISSTPTAQLASYESNLGTDPTATPQADHAGSSSPTPTQTDAINFAPIISTVTSVEGQSTKLVPVFIGGAITSPVPLTSFVTTTIDPTGILAQASASALSAQVVGVLPLIQSWVNNPQPSEASAALGGIGGAMPMAAGLVASLGGGSRGGGSGGGGPGGGSSNPCGGNKGLLGALIDTVRCVANDLGSMGSAIAGVANARASVVKAAVNTVSSTLKDIQPRLDSLVGDIPVPDNNPNDPSHNNHGDPSKNGDGPTDEATQSPQSTSSQETTSQSSSVTTTTAATSTTSSSSSSTSSCPAPTGTQSVDGCGAASTIPRCSANCTTCFDDLSSPPGPLPSCQGCSKDSSGVDGLAPAQTTGIAERSLLEKRRMLGPPDYEYNVQAFLFGQLREARLVPHIKISAPGLLTKGVPSALAVPLKNTRQNFGFMNLNGCTAIIVVSKQGVWLGLFWEVPAFVVRNHQGREVFDRNLFEMDVLDPIENGVHSDLPPYDSPGLGPYLGQWFRPEYKPQAFIITPRKVWGDPGEGILAYPEQIHLIGQKLNQLLPGAPVQAIAYEIWAPYRWTSNPNSPPPYPWTLGKVLFQYDPEERYTVLYDELHRLPQCVVQQAAMQIWIADGKLPIARASWAALPNQLVAHPWKRDANNNASCPISYTANASSTTAEKTTFETSSTAPLATTTSAAPEYNPGKCAIHIFEYSWAPDQPLAGSITIHDAKNVLLKQQNFSSINWGDTVTVSKADTKLPYDVQVEFSKENPSTKKRRSFSLLRSLLLLVRRGVITPPPPPPPTPTYDPKTYWLNWWVKIRAGATSWEFSRDVYPKDQSKLPWCSVGGWALNSVQGWNLYANVSAVHTHYPSIDPSED